MQNSKDTTPKDTTNQVRMRFAPSPTGGLHIGGIRTALYNYLLAKKLGGKIILRIEDTDSTRFVEGAEQYIIESFKWLGLEFDEGPHIGGDYAPYRQSERKDIYKVYANQLIDNGFAYYAFDSTEDIESKRDTIKNFSYDIHTRMSMKNSLTLPKDEVKKLIDSGEKYVIRIKYPDTPITITINDDVRGKVTVNSSTLDDKVLWKSFDQLPTYHLANVVDDYLMKISHVIRGEEWLPSAPLHIFLYDCFGWVAPKFAHLALILNPDGKGKLSKRNADLLGFPVFPLSWNGSLGYKEEGYLPHALLNYLAFLGWNPGTDKEMYSIDELINDFSMERTTKAGARFNPVKVRWFNTNHMKNVDSVQLFGDFKNDLLKRGIQKSDDFIMRVLDNNKGKYSFISELYDSVNFLFEKPTVFEPKALKKWNIDSPAFILKLQRCFSDIWSWNSENIQKAFETFVSDNNLKFGDIAPLVRLLITGQNNGTSMFDIMDMIGKASTMDRLINYTLPTETVITESVISIDDFQKIEKLQKELDSAKTVLRGNISKLSSPDFINRAPQLVVEKEKQKGLDLVEKIKLLEIELAKMV